MFDQLIFQSIKLLKNFGLKANVLCDLGRFDEVINICDKILEIEPQNSKTWFNRGVSLVHLKRLEEAIQNFDKALEFDPKYKMASEARENILAELKKVNAEKTSKNRV